jgi:hypothetical protein
MISKATRTIPNTRNVVLLTLLLRACLECCRPAAACHLPQPPAAAAAAVMPVTHQQHESCCARCRRKVFM